MHSLLLVAAYNAAVEAGGRWHPDLTELIMRFFRASCGDDIKTYHDAARIRRAAPHDERRAHGDGAPRQGLSFGGRGRGAAAAVSARPARPRTRRLVNAQRVINLE